jgi:hypothetical protein
MLEWFDALFISFYQMTGYPLWDYFIGTFLLALLSVLVGQATLFLVFRANRSHIEGLDSRLENLNRLTASAMKLGDKRSYKFLNKEANDTYGHVFFNRFGLSAASLWPVFFALAWIQERFAHIVIPIPWLGLKANYFVVFLLAYIAATILFRRTKKYLSGMPKQPGESADEQRQVSHPVQICGQSLAPRALAVRTPRSTLDQPVTGDGSNP